MQVFDNLNTYTFGEIRDVAEQWSIAIEAKNKYVENKEGSAEDFRESHHEYDSAVDEYRKISGYLARIEHFALGVNIGIYDARVTERATTTYFVILQKNNCLQHEILWLLQIQFSQPKSQELLTLRLFEEYDVHTLISNKSQKT